VDEISKAAENSIGIQEDNVITSLMLFIIIIIIIIRALHGPGGPARPVRAL